MDLWNPSFDRYVSCVTINLKTIKFTYILEKPNSIILLSTYFTLQVSWLLIVDMPWQIPGFFAKTLMQINATLSLALLWVWLLIIVYVLIYGYWVKIYWEIIFNALHNLLQSLPCAVSYLAWGKSNFIGCLY